VNHLKAEAGQVRDKIASAVGMSGESYRQAEAVVDAAAANPERYGDLEPSAWHRQGGLLPPGNSWEVFMRRPRPDRWEGQPKGQTAGQLPLPV
jgi:hypothetical protein